ncbi:hypothetical protein CBM2623_A190089 [Cupriavidus taiwanensis]|nr:hypothetical protein CBM2623_A190089 [Cupriavidus taiwanensis]
MLRKMVNVLRSFLESGHDFLLFEQWWEWNFYALKLTPI